MITIEVEQGTTEWLDARLGRATASRFKDILATLKSGSESSARRNYRAELTVERLTHAPIERYRSAAMAWGSDTEDLARTMYMLKTGNPVEQVGFMQHDDIMAGASPDGLTGLDGTIEIKCYEIANHISALKSDKMPPEHMAQVQGQLWLSGRKWCDFISFAPELPDNAQIFIQRIQRDDDYIKNLEVEVIKFLGEVDDDIKFVESYRKEL